MSKTLLTAVASVLAVSVVLGCGLVDRIQKETVGSNTANSNKTLTDRGVETAVGDQKIGVPECDEVIDMVTAFANNPDDNFVVKAGKQMVANKIRDAIKTSVEENKADKVQLAKDCRELKVEMEKAMKDQGQGGGQ